MTFKFFCGTLIITCIVAQAASGQTNDKFCLRHIEGKQILQSCLWNKGALPTATCIEEKEGEPSVVRTIKYTELKNWEEIFLDEVGCEGSQAVRPERPRGDEYTTVRVFFGTDRKIDDTPDNITVGGERGHELQLGKVLVTVPAKHELGVVERPWSISVLGLTFGEDENPLKHFTVRKRELQDQAAFLADLKSLVSKSEGYDDQAFVFIHGYNVGFDTAAFRTAQIAYDLQFDGAPIFYSWPSKGGLQDYEYDQNSARQARKYLRDFLENVRDESDAETIHLIAHSMGSNPLLEVLADMAYSQLTEDKVPLFNQVILAAPDIDRDVFLSLAEEIRGVAKGVTLYASSADRAMEASRIYAGGVPRAGDVTETGPVIAQSVDTIDASIIDTSFFALNHANYATSRILLDDIGRLLLSGLRPPKLRTPSLIEKSGTDGIYWSYPR